MNQITIVHYFPILTTIVSIIFSIKIFKRYHQRGRGNHLLWWSGGVLTFGLGTFTEGWITLLGWNQIIFKFWYIVGALMGGAPLAQGTVWYLLKPKTARKLTIGLVSAIIISSICVISSPIDFLLVDKHLPSGRVFSWQWVRLFSPFINIYAVIFLVGGSLLSAWRFRKVSKKGGKGKNIARDRFIGNVFIAIGAILPGIGGASSRAGHTEVLYVMELIGISLIWIGYWFNVRKRPIDS